VKVQLGIDELKALARHSKAAGTQDKCIDLLLEWIEEACRRLSEPEINAGRKPEEE